MAQVMLEVVQELAWEGSEAPHTFTDDGRDLVLQVNWSAQHH